MKTAKRLSSDNRSQVDQLTEPEMIKMLERREALEGYAKEFKELDKQVKDVLKAQGKPTLFAGPFIVQITDKQRKRFDYPKAVQNEYEIEPLIYQQVSITRKDS